MVDENETIVVNKEETPAAETTTAVNGSTKESPVKPTEPIVNDKPEEVPKKIPVEQSTPKKSSPQKKDEIQNEKEQSLLKTPERSTPQKPTKHISPIVDESPMPRTKNLVDRWEDIKKDNEKHAKATNYENVKSEKKSTSSAPSRKSISSKTTTKAEPNKNIVTLEALKMKDHIPEIKKKFCMKEKRIRENIKAFNQSYNTVNIDLKENEQKMVTAKPIVKEKRVYVEDEDDTDKVQRSKRVKVSELKKESNNTSLWHKFNSNRLSWKNSLISKKNEITVTTDTTNDKANESLIITPTVKHQEIKAPVRINEDTCLNIFNPSQNKSSIPMLLRLRKSIKGKDEKSQVLSKFTKSNTKPEWVNKLYMVISNDHAIPKLFDVSFFFF